MASIFYQKKPLIGLDISKTNAHAVLMGQNKFTVHGYSSIDLDPEKDIDGSDDNQDYLAKQLTSMFSNEKVGRLNSNRVALGIPTDRAFVRTFELPVSSESSLKETVRLEVEQYIPMPVEALYIDHEIIERDKKNLTVVLCAVPRTLIDNLISATEKANLEVIMIEPRINAVARLLKQAEEGALPTIIVDIGPANTDIAILDSAVRLTGGLNIGGNTLTLDLARKLELSLEASHQLKVTNGLNPGPRQAKIQSSVRPSLMRVVNEVQRIMRYYTDRFTSKAKIEQVIIVGSGSNMPGIGEFFTNELIMPARVASPWQSLNFDDVKQPAKPLRAKFVASAGLAMINQEDIWK